MNIRIDGNPDSSIKLILGFVLNAVLLFSITCVSVTCAETTGVIAGTLRDQAGAVLPGVTITALDERTGFVRSTTTGSDGNYAILFLSPSSYTIKAEHQGFRTHIQRGVVLSANQSVRTDICLEVGAPSESITIESSFTHIETVRSRLGRVIGQQGLSRLPLNGRNYLQLLALQPGVAPPISLTSTVTPPDLSGGIKFTPYVNGLRWTSSSFTLDGSDNLDPALNTSAAVPALDSLEEVNLLTSLYSAEFGGATGAVVVAVTKSGTKTYRGSAYEFFRNQRFDARDFFSLGVPPLAQNQFGGTVSGPLKKDRVFFFVGYEGLRLHEGVTRSAAVPSFAERAGDFSQSALQPIDPLTGKAFPRNVIPADRIDPIARQLLKFYPLPNLGKDQYSSTPVSLADKDQFLVNIDYAPSERYRLSARYLFDSSRFTRNFVENVVSGPIEIPGFPISDDTRFQHLVISTYEVLSPSSINEFCVGFNRSRLFNARSVEPKDPRSYGFTFPGGKDLPLIGIAGLTSIGLTDLSNVDRVNNILQFQDNLSIAKGGHILKFGAELSRSQFNYSFDPITQGEFLFAGAFSGNSFADFLLGKPLYFQQSGGDPSRAWRTTSSGVYAQDDWRLLPNLTINFGLRYELKTPIHDLGNREYTFRPGEQSRVRPLAPKGLLFDGDPGIPPGTVVTDWNNIGPRIGLVWDPFGTGHASIRAGYGVFYDNPANFNATNLSFAPSIYSIATVFGAASFADPFLGKSPFLGGSTLPIPNSVRINPLDKNFRTPYVEHYLLSIQKEFAHSYVVEASYVGNEASKLVGVTNINQALFVKGHSTPQNIDLRRPYPGFSLILLSSTAFSSNYNSLQLSLIRRAEHGVSFEASYTYSKAMDYISTPQNIVGIVGQADLPQDSKNLRAERAPAAFDLTHRFVLSYNWQLPLGRGLNGLLGDLLKDWEISGITALHSGTPFTVIDSSDPGLDGDISDRPDLIGNPLLAANGRSVAHFFNTAAFKRVPVGSGRFGNEGRNILRGPDFRNFDLSLQKTNKFAESVTIQLRAEAFNVFNHANFALPINDINSPSFGSIRKTIAPGRQLQLSVKLVF